MKIKISLSTHFPVFDQLVQYVSANTKFTDVQRTDRVLSFKLGNKMLRFTCPYIGKLIAELLHYKGRYAQPEPTNTENSTINTLDDAKAFIRACSGLHNVAT